jgi:hypothetical protein
MPSMRRSNAPQWGICHESRLVFDEHALVRRNTPCIARSRSSHRQKALDTIVSGPSLRAPLCLTSSGIRWKCQDSYARLQEVSSGPWQRNQSTHLILSMFLRPRRLSHGTRDLVLGLKTSQSRSDDRRLPGEVSLTHS